MAVEHKTGIYEIRNTLNGKRYVGSAVDFGNRWRVHAQSLADICCGRKYKWVTP